MGSVFDKFVHSSKAGDYLKERKSIGAGTLEQMPLLLPRFHHCPIHACRLHSEDVWWSHLSSH